MFGPKVPLPGWRTDGYVLFGHQHLPCHFCDLPYLEAGPLQVGWAARGSARSRHCLDTLPSLTIIPSPQLFGFVFACYVSKVFLEEEDSCE